jgi:hypothetical protein
LSVDLAKLFSRKRHPAGSILLGVILPARTMPSLPVALESMSMPQLHQMAPDSPSRRLAKAFFRFTLPLQMAAACVASPGTMVPILDRRGTPAGHGLFFAGALLAELLFVGSMSPRVL